MSAETLRRAAALMRERADAATAGPWTPEPSDGDVWAPGNREAVCRTRSYAYGPDAEHIASWHPLVALAVADWLSHEAERWEFTFEVTQRPGVFAINYGNPKAAALNADYHARHALTVARAYLGEETS